MKWLRRFFSFKWLKKKSSRPVDGSIDPPPTIEPPITIVANENNRYIPSKINNAGLRLILISEGFSPMPYMDAAGVPTIGYGTTIYPGGKKVKLSDEPVKKAIAREFVDVDLDGRELAINNFLKNIKLQLNENEFSALVSFAYNLGLGWVIKKGSVCKALKAHDKKLAADNMLKFNRARTGIFRKLTVLKGLTIRRNAERKLFLKPVKTTNNALPAVD